MTKTVLWDATRRCNLCCAHCAVSETYRHPQSAQAEMTGEEGLAVLQHLRQADYQQLVLIGGEPLIRHDIAELVAAAHRMGYLYVLIITNGTCLTPQLADALLDAGLDILTVSLDGATAQTNDRVRGQGSYARAIQGLETVLQRRPAGNKLKICVQFTLSRPNLHQVVMMTDLAGKMGLDRLSINELQLAGNVWQHVDELLPSLVEAMDARETLLQAASRYPDLSLQVFGRPRVIEYLNEKFGRDLPLSGPECSLVNGYKTLYVKADGAATPCSAIHVVDKSATSGQDMSPGDESLRLQTHSLSSILASPQLDHLRRIVAQVITEEHWQDEFIPCARCQHRSICQVCPLFLRKQKDRMIRECLLATQRQAQWRKSQKQVQVADREIAPAQGVGHV